MTARYRIIEQVYLSRQSESAKQLQQAVIRLYATTLTYLAKAKRYFEQNTAVRLLQSGLLAKSDLHDLLDKMDVDEREADRCANLVEAEMNKDVAGQIADISLEMKEISALRDALMQTDQPILQMSIQLDRVEDHLDSMHRTSMTRTFAKCFVFRFTTKGDTRLALIAEIWRLPQTYQRKSTRWNLWVDCPTP